MSKLPHAEDFRTPDYPIEPLIWRRWSPRAMSGAPITDEQMRTLFEAARWAPSTYNEQEWRFVYARRDTPAWDVLFHLLLPANQAWCQHGALLAVVVAHKVFARHGKPNPVHLFDCGAATENLFLQATSMGLVSHGMAGFDWDAARTALAVPDDYSVAAMFVVGHPGDPDQLPEGYRELEQPSGRRPVSESIFEGAFKP